jgi:hypothetical protein
MHRYGEGRKLSETTYIAGISKCNRFSIALFGFVAHMIYRLGLPVGRYFG